MWIFENLNCGYNCAFSSKEKGDTFLKQYACHYYDMNGYFPESNQDYLYREIKVDPNIEDVINTSV